MSAQRRILLAAGGTGGHIFPAVAVAEQLLERGYAVCLATDSRGMGIGTRLPGVELHRISAAGIGGGLVAKIRAAAAITVGYLQARRLIARLDPVCVIGFGGYPSVPTMLAAARRRRTMIHEQNAVLGRANRLVAPRVNAIAASFAETAGIEETDRAKVRVTGNPVRAAFAEMRGRPYPEIGPNGEGIKLLVLGGSQGARILSDVVPQAFADMPEPLRRRFGITQQCRPEDLDRVRAAYAAIGLSPELATFFDDVPERMAAAHVVLTRSGASTVAELCEAGRPAIYVPYRYATDDHQTANARAMEALGAAWLIPEDAFTPDSLILRLEGAVNLPDRLREKAAAARSAGGKNAASGVVDVAEALIGARANGGAGASGALREKAA